MSLNTNPFICFYLAIYSILLYFFMYTVKVDLLLYIIVSRFKYKYLAQSPMAAYVGGQVRFK